MLREQFAHFHVERIARVRTIDANERDMLCRTLQQDHRHDSTS
jgi:hypothetical protein